MEKRIDLKTARGTVLKAEAVRKEYVTDAGGSVLALNGVDFEIREGEFVVLIGPTGCGKTTLFNMIAGLDVPTGGNIFRSEELLPGKNMPCVFQHYTLFPWRTVLENVAFGPQMKKIPRGLREKRARELLNKVGLDGFENALPYELSGGMRQRTAIAQALAVKPRLLLMDEPFGALDDSTRRQLQQELVSFWSEDNFTVLFITHNVNEALMLADRILVFSDRPGKVVYDCRVSLERPRDPLSDEFTEKFLMLREKLSGEI